MRGTERDWSGLLHSVSRQANESVHVEEFVSECCCGTDERDEMGG